MLVATTPGSESIDGTVFGPRLFGADRAVGLAYARAIIRTINTHLADGWSDEALAAVAEGLDTDEDALADGPEPLFDWESARAPPRACRTASRSSGPSPTSGCSASGPSSIARSSPRSWACRHPRTDEAHVQA